jgi:hypothetical protein
MKTLLNEKTNIQKLRFWGKIFGIKNNYYIAEADYDLNDSEFIRYRESSSVEEENDIDNQKILSDQIKNSINEKIFYVSTGSKSILENLID